MFSIHTQDHHHLTAEEKAEYARLERRKNELQHALGTASTDVEEVRLVVHRLRELDTIALARAELFASPTGTRPVRSRTANAPSSH
ncbi:MAG TPA: hypothetical protein VMC06_01020 [Opitutaceae bacterium]|nr:hypothetical protein [Opitutaceae bacterium]